MSEDHAKKREPVFRGTRWIGRAMRRFLADPDGATAIEYALLGAMIAVACIASFTIFGEALGNLFGTGPGGAGNVIARQTEKLG